jgi:hypothetical protein
MARTDAGGGSRGAGVSNRRVEVSSSSASASVSDRAMLSGDATMAGAEEGGSVVVEETGAMVAIFEMSPGFWGDKRAGLVLAGFI